MFPAIEYFRSGPPGGVYLPKHAYRLVDDAGGAYGAGANAGSSSNSNKKGVNVDSSAPLDDVLEYLRYLADKGDVGAQFSLGRLYYEGARVVPRNFSRALHYFGKVSRTHWTRDGKVRADTESISGFAAKAAGHLGRMALRGEGGKQDISRAHSWFKKGVHYVCLPRTPHSSKR